MAEKRCEDCRGYGHVMLVGYMSKECSKCSGTGVIRYFPAPIAPLQDTSIENAKDDKDDKLFEPITSAKIAEKKRKSDKTLTDL